MAAFPAAGARCVEAALAERSSLATRVRVTLTFTHMLNTISIDRRWGERIPTDCPSVTYRHGIAHRCRALDLSTGGALLYWPNQQPPMLMRLELTLAERTLHTLARTLWSRNDMLAVRFIGLADAERLDIAEYLDLMQN